MSSTNANTALAQPTPEEPKATIAPAPQAEAQKPQLEAVKDQPATTPKAPEIQTASHETAEKVHAVTAKTPAEPPHEKPDEEPHTEAHAEQSNPEPHETPHATPPAGENFIKKLWGWGKTKAKELWSLFWTGTKNGGSGPPGPSAPHH